jgi:uncharacterized membrane protein YphA (DoxX/SURF4 family)
MERQLLNWYRYVIGYVFVSSGIVKLLVADFKGAFFSMGIPFPNTTLFIVATAEIVCGTLIIGRMYLKQATMPLIVIMIGALLLAKFPVFLNKGLLAFIFESRLDLVMLVLLLVLWRHHDVFGEKSVDNGS